MPLLLQPSPFNLMKGESDKGSDNHPAPQITAPHLNFVKRKGGNISIIPCKQDRKLVFDWVINLCHIALYFFVVLY